MISSNFGFGEQSKIASAYAQMYAPKSKMEESCCKGGCGGKKPAKKTEKKVVKEACADGGLVRKHVEPKKTGSKLGARKMMEFKKRDAKPSCKGCAPKAKKVVESAPISKGYCIVDGNKTLCTNDVNESYFSKDGITGETRIYESAVSALKDIKKVNTRRKPNNKYCIRKCECVGESFQFVQSGSKVDESQNVNEGLWDGIKSIGSGIMDAGKAVGNAAGGVLKGAGNLAQGNFSQAGSDLVGGLKDAGGNLLDAGKNVGGGVLDTATGALPAVGGVAKGVGNALQGNFSQALDDVVDGANSETDGTALLNGAKEGAKAIGNTIAAPLNAVGGVAKAAGNTLQGNFSQAATDLYDGGKAAAQKLIDAKNNVVNAATNTNDEQKKKEEEASAAAKRQTQQPTTAAQNTAAANGAGPVTDAAAQNNPAVKDEQQKQNAATNAVNAVSPAAPDSLKNHMTDNLKANAPAPQQQQSGQQAPQQKDANAGAQQSGENNPGYQQELKALKMKWGVK